MWRSRARKASASALAAGAALALAGCGPDGPTTAVKQSAAARPRFPDWAEPMIGKPMSQFVHGRGDCKGVFDVVLVQYNGRPAGATVGGWGWDKAARQAVPRVVFVDVNDHIVGAADSGASRPDVPAALPEITSKTTGWNGVVGITAGKILAVGVTGRNAACDLGSKDLSESPV